MSTPLRAHYLRLKRTCPDALLLFRLGDVYELYDEDARVAAHELGVTLTAREFAGGKRVTLCPLPYHAVEERIKRLVMRGHTVAVAEQIGDPRTARGLVEREVVRVVTPASTVEAHRHPPSGRGVEPACVDTDATAGMRRSAREVAASVASTGASAGAIAQVSASDTGGESHVAAPARQLALFNLSAGDAGAGR